MQILGFPCKAKLTVTFHLFMANCQSRAYWKIKGPLGKEGTAKISKRRLIIQNAHTQKGENVIVKIIMTLFVRNSAQRPLLKK